MLAAEQIEVQEDKYDDLIPVQFPANEDDPFELIQFTTVVLAHLQTPREFTYALIEFTEPRILEHISKNPADFYLLGMVWLNTLQRIISENPTSKFPYEFLALPILFKEFGWEYEMTDDWKTLYEGLLSRIDNLPATAESHVHISVPLFCMEAIFKQDTPAPFEAMNHRLEHYLPKQQYADALLSLGMILGRNGWYSGY